MTAIIKLRLCEHDLIDFVETEELAKSYVRYLCQQIKEYYPSAHVVVGIGNQVVSDQLLCTGVDEDEISITIQGIQGHMANNWELWEDA